MWGRARQAFLQEELWLWKVPWMVMSLAESRVRGGRGPLRVQQLTCDPGWTEIHMDSPCLSSAGPGQGLGGAVAGSWSVGMGEQPQGEVCC